MDEVTRLTTKTNREVSKRTLNLMDMSGKVVSVTLWGEEVSICIKLGVKWEWVMGKEVLCLELVKWVLKINTSLLMHGHAYSDG